MAEPTAIIQVVCRAGTFDETARMLAWTVGHSVQLGDPVPGSTTRSLLVITNLAYHGQDDTILERLGMDIIGKVAGVLSWEVVPSDQPGSGQLREDGGQLATQQQDMQAQLAEALGALPVPVSLMKRDSGKCVWKWMEATGEADTFTSAATSVLSQVFASYTAVQGELSDPVDEARKTGGWEDQFEAELSRALLSLPAPVGVLRSRDGRYLWQSMEAKGEAKTFVAAVSSVFAHVMTRYLDVRREVMGANPASSVCDVGWHVDL